MTEKAYLGYRYNIYTLTLSLYLILKAASQNVPEVLFMHGFDILVLWKDNYGVARGASVLEQITQNDPKAVLAYPVNKR
jgi:hypothetical protein